MSGFPSSDTIYAFATPPGRSGVAVLRISGSRAASVVEACLRGRMPTPRKAIVRTFRDPRDGEPIDEALVLWMPGPASFTDEDVLEIHLHGGLAVRTAALTALSTLPGLRPAEPGEFARRAFLAGKLDLSQVEGLADLIEAETEAQRRAALRDASGTVRRLLEGWRSSLLDALALVEATLDFSDEELPDGVLSDCAKIVEQVAVEMQDALARQGGGEVLREGLSVVISGPPNAGKSTLLNRIAGRDVAIVTPIAGTTRDVLEVRCDLGGVLVRFADTAGMRESDDPIERIGIERAAAASRAADLVLALRGPQDAPDWPHCQPAPVWRIGSKADLAVRPASEARRHDISCATGDGIAELLADIGNMAAAAIGAADAVLTREHQRVAIRDAAGCLGRGRELLLCREDVLAAEELRAALALVGRVSGRVGVDDVLDRVFGRFCIGK